MIKYWNQRRYTAWFDAEFPLDGAEAEHQDYDGRIQAYVAELVEDIRERGLQNPLLVTKKDGRTIIHPGKCRTKALKILGHTHAPAVVVDFTRVVESDGIPAGCTFLDNVEDVSRLFSGDCRVEMSHRGLTVKKAR